MTQLYAKFSDEADAVTSLVRSGDADLVRHSRIGVRVTDFRFQAHQPRLGRQRRRVAPARPACRSGRQVWRRDGGNIRRPTSVVLVRRQGFVNRVLKRTRLLVRRRLLGLLGRREVPHSEAQPRVRGHEAEVVLRGKTVTEKPFGLLVRIL
jgi:hypothetical protein